MISVSSLAHAHEAERRISFPDFDLPQGGRLLILGPSGCGKSTLLHILAGILAPTQGKVLVSGHDFSVLGESARDRLRGREVGIVFQRLYLSAALSCLDCLRAAQYLAGLRTDDSYSRELLSRLGLSAFERKLPRALSVGQAQRLAIARALVNKPKIVLADEPTSALDDQNAMNIAALLKEHSQICGASLVVATHDARIRPQFEKILELQ